MTSKDLVQILYRTRRGKCDAFGRRILFVKLLYCMAAYHILISDMCNNNRDIVHCFQMIGIIFKGQLCHW